MFYYLFWEIPPKETSLIGQPKQIWLQAKDWSKTIVTTLFYLTSHHSFAQAQFPTLV